MTQKIAFGSRVGDRWSLAIEFEGIGEPPKTWNQWWGSLWLWVNGRVVGRPSELEIVMTGLDSLAESATGSGSRRNRLLSSLPANKAIDLVMWSRYGDDVRPDCLAGEDPLLLAQHEILPRLTGPFFDGWEAILLTESCSERFLVRRTGSQASEAVWPEGTFKGLVLQSRDCFERLASASLKSG